MQYHMYKDHVILEHQILQLLQFLDLNAKDFYHLTIYKLRLGLVQYLQRIHHLISYQELSVVLERHHLAHQTHHHL